MARGRVRGMLVGTTRAGSWIRVPVGKARVLCMVAPEKRGDCG